MSAARTKRADRNCQSFSDFFRESEAAADDVVGGSKKNWVKKVFHGSAISFKNIFDKRKLTKLKIRTLKFLPLEIWK